MKALEFDTADRTIKRLSSKDFAKRHTHPEGAKTKIIDEAFPSRVEIRAVKAKADAGRLIAAKKVLDIFQTGSPSKADLSHAISYLERLVKLSQHRTKVHDMDHRINAMILATPPLVKSGMNLLRKLAMPTLQNFAKLDKEQQERYKNIFLAAEALASCVEGSGSFDTLLEPVFKIDKMIAKEKDPGMRDLLRTWQEIFKLGQEIYSSRFELPSSPSDEVTSDNINRLLFTFDHYNLSNDAYTHCLAHHQELAELSSEDHELRVYGVPSKLEPACSLEGIDRNARITMEDWIYYALREEKPPIYNNGEDGTFINSLWIIDEFNRDMVELLDKERVPNEYGLGSWAEFRFAMAASNLIEKDSPKDISLDQVIPVPHGQVYDNSGIDYWLGVRDNKNKTYYYVPAQVKYKTRSSSRYKVDLFKIRAKTRSEIEKKIKDVIEKPKVYFSQAEYNEIENLMKRGFNMQAEDALKAKVSKK